jgi:inositol oxygenase
MTDIKTFRSYDNAKDNVKARVKAHYRSMRQNQTYQYVKDMHDKFNNREPKKMLVENAIRLLDNFNDNSDPDTSLANVQHLFQSAEGAREKGEERWMILVCLIHDLGKMLYLWNDSTIGCSVDQQWGVTGDTFMLGCKLQDSLIYSEYNQENPDKDNPIIGSALGVYQNSCGLDNMLCAWGHDEYMYQVLNDSKNRGLHKIPEEGMKVIRYHSFYPWHNAGGYREFENEEDKKIRVLITERFNRYDLYTKTNQKLNINLLLDEYYRGLIMEFFPEGYLYF